MKLKIDEILERKTIEVNGTESWLEEIYRTYQAPAGASLGKLSGKITVDPVGDRIIMVAGALSFGPYVDCSRCNDRIPWPVQIQFSVVYQDAPETLQRKAEYKLSRAELDEYYFEDDAIVLADLVNDQISLLIPNVTIDCTADGNACNICGVDLSSEHLFGPSEEEAAASSPFSALKGLKFPKD